MSDREKLDALIAEFQALRKIVESVERQGLRVSDEVDERLAELEAMVDRMTEQPNVH